MPRPEIDVLAYSGSRNEIKAIECKSFLNSRGVIADDVLGISNSKRYKLFTNKRLRDRVLKSLRAELIANGACSEQAKIKLCLACGKIPSDRDRKKLQSYFRRKGWGLFDDRWISEKVRAMADVKYENQVSTVVAKLLKAHFRILDAD